MQLDECVEGEVHVPERLRSWNDDSGDVVAGQVQACQREEALPCLLARRPPRRARVLQVNGSEDAVVAKGPWVLVQTVQAARPRLYRYKHRQIRDAPDEVADPHVQGIARDAESRHLGPLQVRCLEVCVACSATVRIRLIWHDARELPRGDCILLEVEHLQRLHAARPPLGGDTREAVPSEIQSLELWRQPGSHIERTVHSLNALERCEILDERETPGEPLVAGDVKTCQ
mmetsp:Transcript_79031/g.205413  ORF Transcript_79031/g.205413 Transcript_79031/m.205413 type:complete len:230 (-) Transcript_79031:391-1080(-)